jgi:hypothetical protein
MTKQRKSIGVVTMLAALAVAACGGDATSPEEAALNQAASLEIASTLISEIITIGFSSFSGGAASSGAGSEFAAGAASGLQETISETVPCNGGGSMTVQGTFTNSLGSTGTGTYGYDLRQRPNNCVMNTSQGPFTVNGNPEFTVAGSLTVTSWTLGTFQLAYGGGFRWSGRGGDGSCSIDLSYNFNYASSSFSGSGHMCGYQINFNQQGG